MHPACSPPFLAKLILHMFSGVEHEFIMVDTERTYELFDGTTLLLAANVFDCVEVSLQPRFTGEGDLRVRARARPCPKDFFPVQQRCNADIGENLYVNVLLSSGTTMYQGPLSL